MNFSVILASHVLNVFLYDQETTWIQNGAVWGTLFSNFDLFQPSKPAGETINKIQEKADKLITLQNDDRFISLILKAVDLIVYAV